MQKDLTGAFRGIGIFTLNSKRNANALSFVPSSTVPYIYDGMFTCD